MAPNKGSPVRLNKGKYEGREGWLDDGRTIHTVAIMLLWLWRMGRKKQPLLLEARIVSS